MFRRDVAQPGSAHAWGVCGRRFKSSRPDQFFTGFLSLVLASTLLAVDPDKLQYSSQERCQQLVVAGNRYWQPYAFLTSNGRGEYQGVAADLMQRLAENLDLPLQFAMHFDRLQLERQLRRGKVDLWLYVYDTPEVRKLLTLVEPGFLYDPITIVMHKDAPVQVDAWHELIGMRGATVADFFLEEKFARYADRYLYLKPVGELEEALSLLQNQQFDYVLGSQLQLSYALQQGQYHNLRLVPKVQSMVKVYMGFSKQSPCLSYLPYVKQQLLRYQEEVMPELLKKYVFNVEFKPVFLETVVKK